MPMYFNEIDRENVPCSGLKRDLMECLHATDCCRKHGKTPRECLMLVHPSVPEECFALRRMFFECKRSLLDNRQRFRGRKGY